jgi:hypothetical protein
MGKMNRRQFLGSASVSTLMLWPSGPLLVAQQPPERDTLLDHVTREAARIQKDIQARGLRGEHLRAFGANLRLASVYGRQRGLDTTIQRAARRAAGRRTDLLNALEGRTDYEHEKHQLERAFPDLKGLDFDVSRYGTRSRADFDQAMRKAQAGVGFADAHEHLVQMVDGIRARLEPYLADNGGVLMPGRARIQRAQHGSCEMYQMALQMIEIMMDVICALALVDPPLAPICIMLFVEVQVAKLLLLVACGG